MCEPITAILGTTLFTVGALNVTVGGALAATALAASAAVAGTTMYKSARASEKAQKVNYYALPKKIQEEVLAKILEKKALKDDETDLRLEDEELTLYTSFKRKEKNWEVTQEVEGIKLDTDGTYPLEIKEGQKVRVRGEGKGDTRGQKGDLYLIINIKDKEYEVDGVDLTKDVEITPPEAVLGTKKEITTLHGKIGIKIPSKTSSGQMLRLKGLGLPKKNGYGNLNARIKIVIPKDITNKQIELYKKIQER